jgi:hypothetical protein
MSIKIYEFSTGIKPVGDSNNWHSQGFTGEYMNKTIDTIPPAVQEAISNRLFAVAEGGATDQPTFIGREVGDSKGGWSVLAVVTRGRDEWQRPFSAYRYFLCEKTENLAKILKWWDNEKKEEKELIFNPFEHKQVGDFITYKANNHPVPEQDLKNYDNQSIPIILSLNSDKKPPLVIDKIAQQKAEESKQLVAWAYNVEALEAPRSFQVIYPASEKAEEISKRVISSQPNIIRSVQEEQAIKKAISLLSQNKVKSEYLQTIEQGLGNKLINDQYWQAMFDSQGATEATRNSNYSPQMIRLLTLRAMILPNTLEKFLDWMKVRNKQDDHYKISSGFQSGIVNNDLKLFPKITNKINEGVRLIIAQLTEIPELFDSVIWLLQSRDNCWGDRYEFQFADEIDSDLSLMREYSQKRIQKDSFILMRNEAWINIFNEIAGCWIYGRSEKIEKYEELAKLFQQLGDNKMSALFYYVSSGEVPKAVFLQLISPSTRQIKDEIYNLTIKKKLNPLEKFWNADIYFGDPSMNMRLPLFTFIFILSYLIGLLGGFFGNKYIFSDAEKSINETSEYIKENDTILNEDNVKANLIKTLTKNNLKKNEKLLELLICAVDSEKKSTQYICTIPKETLNTSVKDFSTNQKSVTEIKEKLKTFNKEDGKPIGDQDSKNFIETELGIKLNVLSSQILKEQENIISKIYSYQRKNSIHNSTGIIDDNTQKQLIDDIKKNNSLINK